MPTNVLLFPVLPKNRRLDRDAWVADILEHVETRRRVVILFVDNELLCRRYVARNSWMKDFDIEVVLIDRDILWLAFVLYGVSHKYGNPDIGQGGPNDFRKTLGMVKKKSKGTGPLPFSKILTTVMKERDLSVRQVAELAEVSPSVAQDWMSGSSPHDLRAVGRLTKGLGMSFKTLLLGEREDAMPIQNIVELFDETPVTDGIFHVSIKKLSLRKK